VNSWRRNRSSSPVDAPASATINGSHVWSRVRILTLFLLEIESFRCGFLAALIALVADRAVIEVDGYDRD